jgi:hypothetical protein
MGTSVSSFAEASPLSPSAVCPLLKELDIEDNLGSSAWRRATRLFPFVNIRSKRPADVQTDVYVGHDSEALYIGIRCDEPKMNLLRSNPREHDDSGIWEDDVIELFWYRPDISGYYKVVINSDGAITDYQADDISWNCEGIQVLAAKHTKSWSLKVSIPWSSVGILPKKGAELQVNVGRTRFANDNRYFTSWCSTGDSFSNVSTWGKLVLSEPQHLAYALDIDAVRESALQQRLFVWPLDSVGKSGFLAKAACFGDSDETSKGENQFTINQNVTRSDPQIVEMKVAPVASADPVIQFSVTDTKGQLLGRSCPYAIQLSNAGQMRAKRLEQRLAAIDKSELSSRWDYRIRIMRDRINKISDSKNGIPWLERKVENEIELAKYAASLKEGQTCPPVLAFPVDHFSPQRDVDVKEAMRDRTIAITACRNEFESACFQMLTYEELSDVSLKISDLRMKNNTSFPSDNIEFHILKWWYQSGTYVGPDGTCYVPELLLKDDNAVQPDHHIRRNILAFNPWQGPKVPQKIQSFSISAGEPKQIWITAKIDKEQPAGIYRGKISILYGGEIVATVPLSIDVLPIELEPPRETFTAYSYYEYRPNSEMRKGPIYPVNEEFYRNYLELCRDYGMTSLMVQEGMILSEDLDRPEGPRRQYFQKALELRKAYGLTGKTIYHGLRWSSKQASQAFYVKPEEIEQNKTKTAKQFRKALDLLKELYRPYKSDFEDFYVYTVDEPGPKKMEPLSAALNRIVQQKGFKTAQAAASRTGRLLGPLLDLRLVGNPGLSRKKITRPDKSGQTLITYWHPKEEPLHNRVHSGLTVWFNGYHGTAPHAMAQIGKHGWDDFMKEFGMRPIRFVYDGQKKPIPTLQLAAYREGVDDFRYLQTLEQLCSKIDINDLTKAEREAYSKALQLTKALPEWFNQEESQSFKKYRMAIQQSLLQVNRIIGQYSTAKKGRQNNSPD